MTFAPARSARGYSFVELAIVTTIVLILAAAVLPLTKVTIQRQREIELHRVLREMRTAIDAYKDAVDAGLADGSVRSLSATLGGNVWWALCTPAGGDLPGEF